MVQRGGEKQQDNLGFFPWFVRKIADESPHESFLKNKFSLRETRRGSLKRGIFPENPNETWSSPTSLANVTPN
jgi:hypothetical protein